MRKIIPFLLLFLLFASLMPTTLKALYTDYDGYWHWNPPDGDNDGNGNTGEDGTRAPSPLAPEDVKNLYFAFDIKLVQVLLSHYGDYFMGRFAAFHNASKDCKGRNVVYYDSITNDSAVSSDDKVFAQKKGVCFTSYGSVFNALIDTLSVSATNSYVYALVLNRLFFYNRDFLVQKKIYTQGLLYKAFFPRYFALFEKYGYLSKQDAAQIYHLAMNSITQNTEY